MSRAAGLSITEGPEKGRSTVAKMMSTLGTDGAARELEEIRDILQDLFILQAARAGFKKEAVRRILGVGMGRVTRIWKHVAKANGANGKD